MTREELLAAGVPEDKVDAILKLHTKSVKEQIDGNYIPKVTFEAERDKVKTLTEDLTTRDKQISELGKFKGTAEALETKVTTLTEENKTAKENYEAELLKVTNLAAVTAQLVDKVIDPDDVISRLDMEKIKFKDGKIESGLDEQLTILKETKPHYFPTDKTDSKPGGWVFGKTPPGGNDLPGAANPEDEAANFGKQLAQNKVSGSGVAAKAEEHYFK